jgi:hypothetical protein
VAPVSLGRYACCVLAVSTAAAQGPKNGGAGASIGAYGGMVSSTVSGGGARVFELAWASPPSRVVV